MNLQPTLESDLVLIRPLVAKDFENLYAIASDPSIWQQHQNSNRYTLEEFTDFFNQGIACKAAFTILDKKSNKIIGSSRYKVISDSEGVIEIGWSFLERVFWGGTYNKEVKKLLVNHALQYYKQIVFFVHVNNNRSQKAMLKVGGRKMEAGSASWVRCIEDTISYVIDEPINY